ncbi:hypothetical protein BIV57_00795 [Mangrovactinospora gilvigrisea]|uniref:Uncharacterized protein n=2 Tax=Mangrovactinospora gilvigrisea TaxID=1428644 RepID=A0A1J7CCY7_9ACTN|nr:hypothetical protein BIV57_00795 [Mangrovactinospora gilvigrisea]
MAISLIGIGAASQAQASTAQCEGSKTPPAGTLCLHVNYGDGYYVWFGPYSKCEVVRPWEGGVITWVKSNQIGNVHSTYYSGGKTLGTRPAYFTGRPPGYISASVGNADNVRVC